MKRVNGTQGVALLECINPNKNRWAVRCDVVSTINEQGEEEGVSYLEEVFDHEPSLDEIKGVVAEGISLYDESSDVSSFAMGDVSMWLDKSTRAGLFLAMSTQEADVSMKLWSCDMPPISFDLPIADLQNILTSLESYSKATYDQTQQHKREVYNLSTANDVLEYNYREGYPNRLQFTL